MADRNQTPDADFQEISQEEFRKERKEQKKEHNQKEDSRLKRRAEQRKERAEERAKEKADRKAAKVKAKADLKAEKVRTREEKKRVKAQLKADWKAEKRAQRLANRPKRIRRLIIFLVVLFVILGAAGYGYFHYVGYFRTHFLHGTVINGEDVSYQTADYVRGRMKKDVGAYTLTIKERKNEEVLKAADLGWTYVDDGTVGRVLEAQNAWKWPFEMTMVKKYKVTHGTSYDKEKAKKAITQLDCLTGEITEPVDASIKTLADGSYEIVPEVEGNEVDPDKLREIIFAALDAGKKTVDIEDTYVKPKVRADDRKLNDRVRDWNSYLHVNLTYQFGSNTENVNGSYLKQYLSDNGSKISLSTDWIKTLVYQWGEKYNTFGREVTFTTHGGTQVKIPSGGDYGWYLNTDKMIDDLTEAIKNGESGTREPIWLFEAKGWDNNNLTGTYIEISLEDQKLWLYQDGVQTLETDIVSGDPAADRATQKGLFAIDTKKSPERLNERDEQGYEDPVGYWVPYNGGQGIHDAPWRSAFGGEIYKTNGSYGSVNVPPDQMETIYNAVSAGTAVVVY